MFRRAINYGKGSVRVAVTGASIERFLNLCAEEEIELWDVRCPACGRVEATARISGFRRMRRQARRACCRVHLLEKRGLPFLAARFKGRWGLAAGALAAALTLRIMCGYIWTVEIEGCSATTQDQVMKAMARQGFHIGMKAEEVDVRALRNGVLKEMEPVLWLTVNVSGSHAAVQVKERDPAPDMLDRNTPCDLVAGRDGVICELIVREGVAKTAPDQTVAAGDRLVSGEHFSELTGYRLTHASGEVKARTWYSLQAALPVPEGLWAETGREVKRYALVFGSKRINLFQNSGNPYADCDKITEKKVLYAGENFRLPVSLICERYTEKTCMKGSDFAGQAGKLLEAQLEQVLRAAVSDGEIIRTEFSLFEKKGVFVGILEAECLQDIAREAPILRSPELKEN